MELLGRFEFRFLSVFWYFCILFYAILYSNCDFICYIIPRNFSSCYAGKGKNKRNFSCAKRQESCFSSLTHSTIQIAIGMMKLQPDVIFSLLKYIQHGSRFRFCWRNLLLFLLFPLHSSTSGQKSRLHFALLPRILIIGVHTYYTHARKEMHDYDADKGFSKRQ